MKKQSPYDKGSGAMIAHGYSMAIEMRDGMTNNALLEKKTAESPRNPGQADRAKSIPIFLASDNNYAVAVATTIHSILSHTCSFVDFHILDGGISQENKDNILKSNECFKNHSMEFIDISSCDLGRFPNLRHYSVMTFARYFVPELAKNLSRVLYLDVDIICKRDIATLFNHELDGFPLGAVPEDFNPTNSRHLRESIWPHYKKESKYFNCGVLLMDIPKMIARNVTNRAIEMTLRLRDALSCPDQDVFNILFESNYKILDYRFNFAANGFHLLSALDADAAMSALANVVIMHYTGSKPWRGWCEHEADFWEIAKNTAYQGQLPQRRRSIRIFGVIPGLESIEARGSICVCFFGLPLLQIKESCGKWHVRFLGAIQVLKLNRWLTID